MTEVRHLTPRHSTARDPNTRVCYRISTNLAGVLPRPPCPLQPLSNREPETYLGTTAPL